MSSPPTTLGQYQIIREIARSNDIVYEAYDPQMDRRVALKELNLPSGITDAQKDDRIQRFDREAKAAGRLAHPNIMRVFQVANDGERHYMAMEFLDGHTLRNEIDTKGFLPIDRAVEIATAVLKGLGHAHANGVVHRDIKPDNIQLLSSGEIKITDFGIARLTFQPNLTMDGQVFGTPSYMSPEQVVGKEIDARSDLFSVGVLLYEMISGQKPFAGDSVVAITYAIMNREPDMLQQVNHSMWQVINRALDKSPALRYSSAQEMIDALEQGSRASVVLDPPMAPPGQTIYGPTGGYPAPPPVLALYGNPYGAPQGPMPVPPPIVYPYNPYQGGAGGGMAPHTPIYNPQGFPQTPVYYPPPPSRPLLKPETKHFIAKLLLTLFVMGTFVAVVILCVVGLSQAVNQAQTKQKDAQAIDQFDTLARENVPVAEKINRLEPLLGHLHEGAAKEERKHRLAVLYEQLGKAQMQQGTSESLQAAETAFKSANVYDPENPKLMTDLAVLFGKYAQQTGATDSYRESISWWDKAANVQTIGDEERNQYLEEEGAVYYSEASSLFKAAQYEAAGNVVQEALGKVPEKSRIYAQLTDLGNQIRLYGSGPG